MFGFPLSDILSSGGNLTTGILSALSGIQNDSRFLQISAPIQAGNSGGPLMDDAGNVIGVVTSQLDTLKMAARSGDVPQNINFAIKGAMMKNFLDSNGRAYQEPASRQPLSTVQVADLARGFSVKLNCKT